MASYTITTSNYADPSFWSSISVSSSGHTLDFTQLPSWFVIVVEPASSVIWIWDGSTWLSITEAGGGGFASLGSPTELHYFNEILVGDAQANLLGSDGADTLITGDGADTIEGGLGDDSISAGGGSDIVWGGDGADTILGGADNDTLSGNAGADTIDGGDGNDQIQGGQGGDSLAGGAGDDFILGDGQWYTIGDHASGSTGAATTLTVTNSADGPIQLWWIDGTGTLQFYATIQPGETYVQPTFEDHNWVLRDDQGYYLELIEGAANQTFDYGAKGLADSISGGDGNDTIYGQFGNDTIDGGVGADLIHGGTGNDSLLGGGGDDTIFGGDGNDVLNGGPGTDSILGGAGLDVITVSDDHGTNIIDGGADYDQLVFATPTSSAGITVVWTGSGQGTYDFNGTTADGSFTSIEQSSGTGYSDTYNAAADSAGIAVYALGGDDTVTGGSGNDRIDGGDGSDSLTGGAGDDTIEGGDGKDSLSGGDGNDLVFGGDGNDVFFDDGSGNDTYYGGAGDDTLRASLGQDVLYGGDGNDSFLIHAGAGDTTIFGGENEGDSDYLMHLGGAAGNTVMFTGNEAGTIDNGTRVVTFSELERLKLSVGNDIVDATATIQGVDVQGDLGNDTMTGGTGADKFYGGEGSDVLYGGAGDDTLFGGADDDFLAGDDGNDSIDGGAGDDLLLGGAGDDTLRGGAGYDFIMTGDGADVVILEDGGGDDQIIDFDMTLVSGKTVDQLDVSLLTNVNGDPVTWLDVVVTDTNGDGTGDAILTFPGGDSVVLQGVAPGQVDGMQEMARMGIPCFAAGSPILTPSGPRPVETLTRGDFVITQTGPAPVIWAGSRSLGPADLAADPNQRPIHFAAGAIGNSVPLRLSPQHAVQIVMSDGLPVLVRAKHLAEAGLRGVRIARGVKSVTYHHLLLQRHSTLSAAGASVETMYPGHMALASFPIAARLAIAAAIIGSHRVGVAGVIDLADLSQIYGPRCFPLLGRREALRPCLHQNRGARAKSLASCAPLADGEPVLAVEPIDAVDSGRLALAAQQHEEPPVAKPTPLVGQIAQPSAQRRVRRASGAIADHRSISANDVTGPPFRQAMLGPKICGGFALHGFAIVLEPMAHQWLTLPLFCNQVLHRRQIQHLFGQKLLELGVLVLERLQPPGLRHGHASELGLPVDGMDGSPTPAQDWATGETGGKNDHQDHRN